MPRPAVLSAAAALVVLAGCHGGHVHVGHHHHSDYTVDFVVTVEGSGTTVCCAGDTVHLQLELANHGPFDDAFDAPDGEAARFLVFDAFGTLVWNSSLHFPPSGVRTIWDLPAGHTLITASEWDVTDDAGDPVPPGTYTIVAQWRGHLESGVGVPDPAPASIEVVSVVVV